VSLVAAYGKSDRTAIDPGTVQPVANSSPGHPHCGSSLNVLSKRKATIESQVMGQHTASCDSCGFVHA
jgi:hypothetical protein